MLAPVLLTGAVGLVGRAVCQRFDADGINYMPLVRSRCSLDNAVICDLSSAKGISLTQPVRAIVHLAAAVPMAAATPDTEVFADVTRMIDKSVLDLARMLNCPVIYASSCGLYDRSILEVKQESNLGAINAYSPYLRAKLEGEAKFLEYGNVTIMRISAPVGPGQRKSSVVSRFIEQARSGQAITLWGSGRREQNFISVKDVADFIVRALKTNVPGIYNVASSQPVSMKALAEAIVATVGRGEVTYLEKADPNDADTARFDTSRALETFGWRSETSLPGMLNDIPMESFKE